jgi:hypothetical protein
MHTKVLRQKHSAAPLRASANPAQLTPEPMVRLDVASSNVRGGFFPNIGSTGSDAGRYQGAIAEKAVPFPNAARRSQLSPHLSVRTFPAALIASRAFSQLKARDDPNGPRRS